MLNLRSLFAGLFIGFSLVGTSLAHADIDVVNTLTDSHAGATDGAGITDGAQQFHTDSVSRTLISVTVALRGLNTDTIHLQLFGDNSGQPGTALLDLGEVAPLTSSDFSAVTAVPGTGFTLQGNTEYWLVGTYGGVSNWGAATTSDSTGSGSIGDFALSGDNGSTWMVSTGDPYLLEITASGSLDTPEPGAAALLMTLGITSGIFLRRRQSSPKSRA